MNGSERMAEGEFTFTIQGGVDPSAWADYFGQPAQRPTHSVLIDHVEWVSGMPPRPQPRRGWRGVWDWLTRRHQHALHLHAIREAAWVEAGCPHVPVMFRTYIPSATITAAEDVTP